MEIIGVKVSGEHLSSERCPELRLLTQASDLHRDMLSARKTQSLKAKPVNHWRFAANIALRRIMRVFISQASASESGNRNRPLLEDPGGWD